MIKWYINRLRTISIAEFPYRMKQFFIKQYERNFFLKKSPVIQAFVTNGNLFPFTFVYNDIYPDSILIFGKQFNYLEQNINWHEDIYSGQCFPISFSKAINIRRNSNLSAKNVWEVNRLQFLYYIGLNYRKTGSDIYINQFKSIVASWIDDNPFLLGVNWYSNIEINIRLIVWFFCWQFIDAGKLMTVDPEFKKFVEDKWIPSIYQHCKFSYSNPSKYSSSNNHLISEYAGLFVATSLWQFKESKEWNRYSKDGLEKEIVRQHSENGINREEAAEYIQFITDFFLVAWVTGEKTNNSFSTDYKNQLKKIIYYIYNFLDVSGNFPQYGDEDDGKLTLFDPDGHFNNFKSLLTSGAIIFNDPLLKSKSNLPDQKNLILFGDSCLKRYHEIDVVSPDQNSSLYPGEGHFILRKQKGLEEVFMHFDAAPLGYLSIAAHGHADALSFVLHVDGQPILVDPGTYTYHTEPEWRKYFIGTLAHNTIRINKHNQAIIAGPTLWLQHFKTTVLRCVSTEENDIVVAQHNGYKKFGIIHKREISFDKKSLVFKITDTIESKSGNVYNIDMPFHCHPLIKVTKNDNNHFSLINPDGRNVSIVLDSKLNIKLVHGQIEPELMGWYSGSFLKREASNMICCTHETSGNAIFETTISIN